MIILVILLLVLPMLALWAAAFGRLAGIAYLSVSTPSYASVFLGVAWDLGKVDSKRLKFPVGREPRSATAPGV